MVLKRKAKMVEGLRTIRRKTTNQAEALLHVLQGWEETEDPEP